MNFFPLDQLGAREDPLQPGVVDFGVLLPGITPADGTLSVKIIHQHDQFLQDIQPVEQPLTHGQLDGLGDYCSGTVDINGIPKPVEEASWGQIDDQQYVYRYVFTTSSGRRIDDILDPFAREYGYGDIAAITLGHQPFHFDKAVEAGFKTPNVKDAIVYELNIEELGGDLTKTLGLLDYLADLGVNVLEVMPVGNTAVVSDQFPTFVIAFSEEQNGDDSGQ